MGIGSNYIRGCFFNKSGTCSLLPCAGSTACSWVVVFPLAWSSVHMFLLLCAHQSLWELVHSREGGRVLERILTLVFRCTGVSFTGTGVGESIYSTVDSCNSTIPVTGAPGRSDEDISRRCHPRCPVGRAPVGEGVEGGGAVGGGGGDGEGRGGGGGRHSGVHEEGEGGLLFQGVDLCDLSCYTESP